MFLIGCILVVMCACNNQTTQPSSAISTDTNSSAFEEDGEEASQQDVDPNRFYKAQGAFRDDSYFSWYSGWNRDGSFWIQDLNTIKIIDRDNRLLKTITIDASKLPLSYNLTLNEDKILAIYNQSEDNWDEYGAVYHADGEISLCGVSIWDLNGKLIKEYSPFPFDGDKAARTGEDNALTTPDGAIIDWWRNLYDGALVYWLDDHTIAINAHSQVIIYDLDNDTGRIVDEMVELVEKHGKFGVYYGVDMNFCYVYNGDFYYLAHKNEEKGNSAGTIWRVGKDDAEATSMFEGKEFTHLYMNEQTMVLTEMVESSEYGYNLWCADALQGALNEMGYYQINIPIYINGPRISMYSDKSEKYCYDTEQPAESALTVFNPQDAGVGQIFGTFRSTEGNLKFIVSVSDATENAPISFCVMNAVSDEKICIYKEGNIYDKFLISPDESCGVVFGLGNQDNLPQVRVIRLDTVVLSANEIT